MIGVISKLLFLKLLPRKSFFSSHALLCPLYDLFWYISLLRHQTWALASQRCQPLLYGGTNATWSILAGPICSDYSFCSYCKDALIFAHWDAPEFLRIFWKLHVRPSCELFIVSVKILALAGFNDIPFEIKIFKAHTLPSELAGPGESSHFFIKHFCE